MSEPLIPITSSMTLASLGVIMIRKIQNYKEVKWFIKKLHVCDVDVIKPENSINCKSLSKYYINEYHNLVEYKWWEIIDGKGKSQDHTMLLKTSTVSIY